MMNGSFKSQFKLIQMEDKMEIEKLYNEMFAKFSNDLNYKEIITHPVTSFTEVVKGRSFFPIGLGLHDKSSKDTKLDIMILGQDWGSKRDYDKVKRSGEESLKNPTWKNMTKLLELCGIDLNRCFFTNAFMGIRTGDSSINSINWKKDLPNHYTKCQEFFLTQLEFLKPKLIIVLGKPAANFLGDFQNNKILLPWKNFSYKKMDLSNEQLKKNVVFNLNKGNLKTTIVSIVHPCYRLRNVGMRSYNNSNGNEAEVNMIKDAMQNAFGNK